MKRPIFLTIMLVLATIGGLAQLWNYYSMSVATPSLLVTIALIMGAVNLVATILLWMWKKLGFYLLILGNIAGVILSFNTNYLVGVLIINVVTILLVYLSMKSVWNQFK